MSDPERLVNDSTSPLARELLSAARGEQPPSALLERTLVAVGAGSALGGTSAAAAASSAAGAGATVAGTAAVATAKASSSLVAIKWLGVGLLGGAVTATAVYETRDAMRSPSPPQAAQTAAIPQEARPEPVSAAPTRPSLMLEPAQPTEHEASPSSPDVGHKQKSSTEQSRELAAEVAALDTARQALGSGDSSRALSLLDAYRERFPEARLLPEALYIRMEALAAGGNQAEAARIAERLLAGFPKSPHAARARRVAEQARR